MAFMRKPVGGTPLDAVLVRAIEQTAKLLEELGHHVEEGRMARRRNPSRFRSA